MRMVRDMGNMPTTRARHMRLMGRMADVTLDSRRHLALHRQKRKRHHLSPISFPAKSGVACAGDALSATAVTAAASGRIGDFGTTGPYQRYPGWMPQQGKWERADGEAADRLGQLPAIIQDNRLDSPQKASRRL